MGERTDQIETHIEQTRETLGSNLHELERKIKDATDWRQQFQKNPITLIGVAFGGGVLLASMLGRQKRRRYISEPPRTLEPHAGSDHQKSKALETWDNIKGALIGVAAAQFKDYVGQIIPGFHEQFDKAQRKNAQEPSVRSLVRS
jgi:hypothetical protein